MVPSLAISRKDITAAGSGVLSGVLYLAALSGVPGALMFVYMAQLPLLASGLGLGAGASLTAGLAATLCVGIVLQFVGALTFVTAIAAPAFLLCRMALLSRPANESKTRQGDLVGEVEWYPTGTIIMGLTAFGFLVFAAFLLHSIGSGTGAEDNIHTMIREGLSKIMIASGGAPTADMSNAAAQMAEKMAAFFPALAFLSWITMTAANAALAQGLLVRFGKNIRPTPDIANLSLPQWLPIALATAGVLAFLTGGDMAFAARNAAIFLAVPYFFAGLGVAHVLIRSLGGAYGALTFFYGLMLLLGWPVFLVASMGFVDQWAGLRSRILKSAAGK